MRTEAAAGSFAHAHHPEELCSPWQQRQGARAGPALARFPFHLRFSLWLASKLQAPAVCKAGSPLWVQERLNLKGLPNQGLLRRNGIGGGCREKHLETEETVCTEVYCNENKRKKERQRRKCITTPWPIFAFFQEGTKKPASPIAHLSHLRRETAGVGRGTFCLREMEGSEKQFVRIINRNNMHVLPSFITEVSNWCIFIIGFSKYKIASVNSVF